MPAAFDAVCRRSAACYAAAPASSWTRLVKLTRLLARRPIAGYVPDDARACARARARACAGMNAVGLVNLLNDAAEDPEIYREIDAAARAFLDDHDPAPLLRLNALRRSPDEAYFGQPVSDYSVELYLADRWHQPLHRARQRDPRCRRGQYDVRFDPRSAVRRRSAGNRLDRRPVCARRAADPRRRRLP
jgi:hypothetical protein